MVALGFGIGSVQCKEDKPTEFSCSHRPHNYAIQGNKSSAKWKPLRKTLNLDYTCLEHMA